MDPYLNKYDLHHRLTHHGKMTDTEWEDAYKAAWDSYFSDEHIETVARRHGASSKRDPGKVVQFMTHFRVLYDVEGIHPLEGGVFRLKYRTDRRPDRPMELPGVFHLKLAGETVWKLWNYAAYTIKALRIAHKVRSDPKRLDYMDTAISVASDTEHDVLEIFTETSGGTGAVEKKRAADRRREIFSPAITKVLAADR